MPGLTAVVDHPIRPADRPSVGPCDLPLGRAGDDGRPGPAHQSDLRVRLRVDVGRPGSDLSAARSVRRATNPLRTIHRGLAPWRASTQTGSYHPAEPSWRVAGRSWSVRIRLARAGAAGPDHTRGAAVVGIGLVGDLGAGRHRLRAALDQRGRSLRSVREHARPDVYLAAGR